MNIRPIGHWILLSTTKTAQLNNSSNIWETLGGKAKSKVCEPLLKKCVDFKNIQYY